MTLSSSAVVLEEVDRLAVDRNVALVVASASVLMPTGVLDVKVFAVESEVEPKLLVKDGERDATDEVKLDVDDSTADEDSASLEVEMRDEITGRPSASEVDVNNSVGESSVEKDEEEVVVVVEILPKRGSSSASARAMVAVGMCRLSQSAASQAAVEWRIVPTPAGRRTSADGKSNQPSGVRPPAALCLPPLPLALLGVLVTAFLR
ncbi:MAG: hypothetical protein M1826_006004 [Phylliscum demangeonii]|nr:MAG: hypothetical protein M1826_006004 [Phylliscum demangeonii]